MIGYLASARHSSEETTTKTLALVQRQMSAMGSALFEIGLYKIDAMETEPPMILRVWDAQTIVASLRWLRYQNSHGRNIYVRPKGEHNLSLVDDLTADKISAMKRTGFDPAIIVETSPGNHQVWLRHSEQLNKELSTLAARTLAERFGGDSGSADWRHFGRLSTFTNRKPKYIDPVTGHYPFVRLIEARGEVYSGAERFLADVKQDLTRRQLEAAALLRRVAQTTSARSIRLKGIDAFRGDPRYSGDGTRIDLAYAVYALSHGASASEVESSILSRDLSHKGNERRQREYVERTIKKALSRLDRDR